MQVIDYDEDESFVPQENDITPQQSTSEDDSLLELEREGKQNVFLSKNLT